MNIILIDHDTKKIYSHKENIGFKLFVNKKSENLFMKYSDRYAELINKKYNSLMRIERISIEDMFDEWQQCEYIGTMGVEENKQHVFQCSWWYILYIPLENRIKIPPPLVLNEMRFFHIGKFYFVGRYWVNVAKTSKYMYDIVDERSRSIYCNTIESPHRICNLIYRALKDRKLDIVEKIAALLRLGVNEIGNIKLDDLCPTDFNWDQDWNPPDFSWDKIEKAIYEENTAYKVVRNLP